MYGRGQIADFHPADRNRIQAHERGLNYSVGRLEGGGPAILFGVDVEFFGYGARDHSVACAGIDDEPRCRFLIQRGLDDNDLSLLFERDRSLARRDWNGRRWDSRGLNGLYAPRVTSLYFRDVMQIVREMNYTVLIHPAIIFGSDKRG